MTITLHEDVVAILQQEATSLSVTLEEAANFLIRFATTHKASVYEREMMIIDSHGERIYDYGKTTQGEL